MNNHTKYDDNEFDQLKSLIRETPVKVDLVDSTMKRYANSDEGLAGSGNFRSYPLTRTYRRTFIITIAAIISFIILTGSSFISPTMASTIKQIPGMASIFQFASDLGLKTADEKGLVTKLNVSDTHNGLTLNVPIVMYDGVRVSIGIERQTTDAKFLKEDVSELISNVDLSINGHPIRSLAPNNSNSLGIYTFPSKDTDSVIIEFSDLRNQGGKRLPAQFDLTLNIIVNGIEEPFIIEFPVKKNSEDFLVLNPSLSREYENINVTITSVELTPITTSITTQISLPEDSKFTLPLITMGVDIMNDQGHKIKLLSGNGWNRTNGNIKVSDYRFEPFESIPKTITIKPYKHLFDDTNMGAFQLDENGYPKIEYIPELEVTLPIK